jgi:hypothetical protein
MKLLLPFESFLDNTVHSCPQSDYQEHQVYAIEHGDFDADGDVDIVLGGNLYRTKPEVGIYDASHGVFLEQDGASNFVSVKDGRGFSVLGEIRDFKVFDNTLYVLRNNDSIKSFKYSE